MKKQQQQNWPLFKTGLKERHENVGTATGASVFAPIICQQ